MKTKIVFTGGHHNSSLEVAKKLEKLGYEIHWIGHKFAAKGDKSLSAEYQEVTSAGFPFYILKTGKFYRQNPFAFFLILFGFVQAFFYLIKIRPKVIVSFGGYLAVPVVISGWLLRIKSLTHEQTVIAGWANKAIAPFVQKILLTHPSSLNNYPKEKTLVVGLPLRSEILDPSYKKQFDPPLLYISCGKQGSHLINQAIFPIIPELVNLFTVVHQTGANTLYKDLDRARRVKESLGEYSNRYLYAPYYFAKDAATYLQSSKVVISRSGAHLTYELIVLGKKTIFIPISWVSHNEQLKNAQLASKHLPSLIIEEKDLDSSSLYSAIKTISTSSVSVQSKVRLPLDATQKVVKAVVELAQG